MTTSTRPSSPSSGRSWARGLRVAVALIALAVVVVNLGPVKASTASPTVGSSGTPVVRVSGNHFVNGHGARIRLIGVDQAGAESACVAGQGFGIPFNFGAPSLIASLKSWKINAVRLPLNEDCWLGINLPHPQFRRGPLPVGRRQLRA